MTFTEVLARHRAVGIVRAKDGRTALEAMEAAVRGGFRVVEITMNTPGALEVIAELAKRPELVVGAGTVLRVEDAEAAARVGATFFVSPVFDEGVVAAAGRLGLPILPGCSTPTEMWRAHVAGVQVVKLFPAPADGPGWVRAARGPMPFLKIVPTQGVDAGNAKAWLEAGCVAVGSGMYVFPPEALASRDWGVVEERARTLIAAVAGGG